MTGSLHVYLGNSNLAVVALLIYFFFFFLRSPRNARQIFQANFLSSSSSCFSSPPRINGLWRTNMEMNGKEQQRRRRHCWCPIVDKSMKQLQFAWFTREEKWAEVRRGGEGGGGGDQRGEERRERRGGGVCRHQTTCPALIVYLMATGEK